MSTMIHLLWISLFVLTPSVVAAATLDLYLWPNGRVPYRFADAGDHDPWGGDVRILADGDKRIVETQMDIWELALEVADPLDPTRVVRHIDFVRCLDRCAGEDYYLLIRYN